MSLVNSTKDFTKTKRKMNLNKNYVKTKTKAALMCAQQHYRRDGRNSRDYDRRVANRNQQTQKKANPQTAKESEPKTLKHVMMKREKW